MSRAWPTVAAAFDYALGTKRGAHVRQSGSARRFMPRRLLIVLVASCLSLAGTGSGTAASSSVGAIGAKPGWVTAAKQRLSTLDVKSAGSMSGYSRAKFGSEWDDVYLNGCDTRNDILVRDLDAVVFKKGSRCVVAKGVLEDRYTASPSSSLVDPARPPPSRSTTWLHSQPPGGPARSNGRPIGDSSMRMTR